MEKRGQLVYKALISIIASAIVVIAFIAAGKTYGNQEAYYKLAVAKDLALVIDLMYSLPGDIEYVYATDVFAYGIEIKNGNVRVYDYSLGKLDPTAASYNYVGFGSDAINANINGLKFVKLSKINGKVIVTGVLENFVAGGGKTGGGGASAQY